MVCDRFHRLLWALTEHDLLQHVGAMQVARTQLVDDPQRILPTQRPTSFELSTGASGQKAAVAREFLSMHERPRRRTMPTMRKLIGEMVAAEEAIAASGIVADHSCAAGVLGGPAMHPVHAGTGEEALATRRD